jgi:hypothetical protein
MEMLHVIKRRCRMKQKEKIKELLHICEFGHIINVEEE